MDQSFLYLSGLLIYLPVFLRDIFDVSSISENTWDVRNLRAFAIIFTSRTTPKLTSLALPPCQTPSMPPDTPSRAPH